MSLAVGTRIGSYEILSSLGAGGMGEVYRARDTRLDRDVAVKMLPDALATDPERLARFDREAKTLASLNHPHIAQIYGVEGGTSVPPMPAALVMELVEGEDLSRRLMRGPLSLEEAIPIARQIADALQAAHDRAVIHRDLKPANIKVRPDGTVKVLDFGLARALAPAAFDAAQAREAGALRSHGEGPTITSPAMTAAGMILGTPAYMSPEQATGKPVDARTDIWAFGCVLYEMLTGRSAFGGDSFSAIIAEVMKGEPDWRALPNTLPPRVVSVLQCCLAKDPTQRFYAMGDVRLALDGTFDRFVSSAGTTSQQPLWWRALPWAIAAATLAAAIAVGARPPVPPDEAPVRFPISSTESMRMPMGFTTPFAIAPDGTRVAFIGESPDGTSRRLWLRTIDDPRARMLDGTDNGAQPAFSPDGQWLAFIADNRTIKKVAVNGGSVTTVTELAYVSAALSWLSNDEILFETLNGPKGIQVVSANGGTPREVVPLDTASGEVLQRRPVPFRRLQLVAFESTNEKDESGLAIASLADGRRALLGVDGIQALGIVDGRLIYARENGVLMAAPFDAANIRLTGPPVQLREQVFRDNVGVSVALSESGTLVSRSPSASYLTVVDPTLNPTRIGDGSRPFEQPRFSPDGTRIVVGIRAGDGLELWLYDVRSRASRRLTTNGRVTGVEWAPDGRRVLYTARGAAGIVELWTTAIDGSSEPTRIEEAGSSLLGADMGADGSLVLWRHDAQNQWELAWLRNGMSATRLVTVPERPMAPQLSPDGRLLAYDDQRAQSQVIVRALGSDMRIQVSGDRGAKPVWGSDSRLFYRLGPTLMEAELATTPTLRVVGQRRIPLTVEHQVSALRGYDVAPDGRFVLLTPVEGNSDIIVTINWARDFVRRWPR